MQQLLVKLEVMLNMLKKYCPVNNAETTRKILPCVKYLLKGWF